MKHRTGHLKTNKYLLLNHIMYLNEHGIRWFDLGSIYDDTKLVISTFLLGFYLERYLLIVEGWSK